MTEGLKRYTFVGADNMACRHCVKLTPHTPRQHDGMLQRVGALGGHHFTCSRCGRIRSDDDYALTADDQHVCTDCELAPIMSVCADGGMLCPSCVIDEATRIADVDPTCPDDDQWRIIGTQPATSGDSCDHCNELAPIMARQADAAS
jgi:hypothetical protein